MDTPNHARLLDAAGTLWSLLGADTADLDRLALTGPDHVLPSVFDVTAFASGAVGVAALAAAELHAARTSTSIPWVEVDSAHAAAAFQSEALFNPRGWERPAAWDPIAGDYRAADRWIRLHTNYASHRVAALSVLGCDADRGAVEAAVARWNAEPLESAIVDAGGCAAVMYDRDAWNAHPHGRAIAGAPAITLEESGRAAASLPPLPASAHGPLTGIRILDLTRVIAGPECTRFLAAHGAEVLRIDPPGFAEVPALVPETTVGKRCATLDLASPLGRARFEALLAEAHVLVHGLRPGALEALGLDAALLRRHNPALVVAALDAYGWSGPWQKRRGFDSLVQMSCGIAAAGAAAKGTDRPTPLPAQALDHGIGYLLAAGVCRALTRLLQDGRVTTVRGSLIGAANWLFAAGPGDPGVPPPRYAPEIFEEAETAWGPVRQVRCPGIIDGRRPSWAIAAGPLGRHEPSFG
ncbi:MAG: CoA transferase [Minicystis sp.]